VLVQFNDAKWTFDPAELKLYDLHAGQQVKWVGSDDDVPAGSIGEVLGPSYDGVEVKFLTGTWTFKPDQLEAEWAYDVTDFEQTLQTIANGIIIAEQVALSWGLINGGVSLLEAVVKHKDHFSKGVGLGLGKAAKDGTFQAFLTPLAVMKSTALKGFYDGITGENNPYGTAAQQVAVTGTAWIGLSQAALFAGAPAWLAGYAGFASLVSQMGLMSVVAKLCAWLGITAASGAPLYGAAATSALAAAVGGPAIAASIVGIAAGGGAFVLYKAFRAAAVAIKNVAYVPEESNVSEEMKFVFGMFFRVIYVQLQAHAAKQYLVKETGLPLADLQALLNESKEDPKKMEKLGELVVSVGLRLLVTRQQLHHFDHIGKKASGQPTTGNDRTVRDEHNERWRSNFKLNAPDSMHCSQCGKAYTLENGKKKKKKRWNHVAAHVRMDGAPGLISTCKLCNSRELPWLMFGRGDFTAFSSEDASHYDSPPHRTTKGAPLEYINKLQSLYRAYHSPRSRL
jgi:hypothetical protein